MYETTSLTFHHFYAFVMQLELRHENPLAALTTPQ